MTIEIDNWRKIPSSTSAGGVSLNVAYNMQSIRRIRSLKSTIVNLEEYLEDLESRWLQLGEWVTHHALEVEVAEELEQAHISLSEERSHQANITPAHIRRDGYMHKDDPDSVICVFGELSD